MHSIDNDLLNFEIIFMDILMSLHPFWILASIQDCLSFSLSYLLIKYESANRI